MALSLSRPSLRRQDFDHVLDALVHDRLTSGEVTRQLGKEAAAALKLKETSVLASVGDGIRRIASGLGWLAGDRVVLSPLAPFYWADVLESLGVVPLFADVLENSPVLDSEQIKPLLAQGAKAIVADSCLGTCPTAPVWRRWACLSWRISAKAWGDGWVPTFLVLPGWLFWPILPRKRW